MNLLSSELLKLRTTRAPWVLLVLTALFSGLVAAVIVGSDSLEDDPALALAQGASFWSTLAAIAGILLVANEYRHGTIMTTFLAEPRRERVLLAKVATAALAGLVFALGGLVAVAAVALPWLGLTGEELPLGAQALEASGRLLLAFALWAALGAAIGAVVQSQVGAIVGFFVWFLVIESIIGVVAGLLTDGVGEPDPVSRYLPGTALQGIVGGDGSEFMLRGGPAALLALGYVAAASVLGAVAMRRRDPS